MILGNLARWLKFGAFEMSLIVARVKFEPESSSSHESSSSQFFFHIFFSNNIV